MEGGGDALRKKSGGGRVAACSKTEGEEGGGRLVEREGSGRAQAQTETAPQ